MDRRELLAGLGITAMAAGTAGAFAQHEHHGVEGGPQQPLIKAASACSNAAELCLTHCLAALAAGDKSLQACAATSREVATVCTALRSLAAQNAPHLAAYAKVAAEICKACEAECRKHPQHATCTSCADTCAACAAECEKTV